MPRLTTTPPIHPGEILLEEFLKAYDPPVTQVEAAERMHIPPVRLNQFIRGNRGVTPDTALRLSDLTGTSPDFWLNLQARYDLWHAQRDRLRRKDAKIRAIDPRRRPTGEHEAAQRSDAPHAASPIDWEPAP
jgi:addiction module HigA family antidote